MKERLGIVLGIIIFLTLSIIMFYYFENYTKIYYTQIDNTKIEKISNGDYKYTLDSYDERGNKKTLKFKTSRELKSDAYLKLEVYYLGVHSWEEVSYEDMPEKVRKKYKK